jgi:hypothetical protein
MEVSGQFYTPAAFCHINGDGSDVRIDMEYYFRQLIFDRHFICFINILHKLKDYYSIITF